MRRVVWNIEKERLAGLLRLVDELQGEIRPQERRVPVLAELGRVARDRPTVEVKRLLPAFGQFISALKILVGKEDAPGSNVQDAIETPLPRRRAILLAEMPLARHRREVPGLTQHFGDGHASIVETAGRARRTLADHVVEMPHAGLVRIEPGQQAGARRRAARGDVELREA